ncbi:MAG: XRE family transcriptional regulator [Verrucomicrobiota bacterium]
MAARKSTIHTPEPESINELVGRRVKKLRQDCGWSLDEMAEASGVSRSMLSEIERERANPTLTVAFRIARAFGMSLENLVEGAGGGASSIQVIRTTDQAQVFRNDKQCQIRTLSPLNLEKDVEFYELRLKKGGTLSSQPHFEGTREFLTVEEGTVRIASGENSEILAKGDSGTYRADIPHAITNTGRSEAVVFLVVIYR